MTALLIQAKTHEFRIPPRGRAPILWGFLLSLSLLGFLGSDLFPQSTVTIEGSVRSSSGSPLTAGVSVRLETLEGQPVAQAPVNSDGHFIFMNLNKIGYVLIVAAKGYETYQGQINSQYAATDYVHNVTLTPDYKFKRNAESLPSRTDTLAPRRARKEYDRGKQALAHRDAETAQSHFAKAVSEFPCYARAQTGLATVLILQRDAARAEAALRKAQECDPDFLDSYIELGQLLNNERKYSQSVTVLQEGVRRSPASWQFYYQLGVAHAGLAQYKAAEEDYGKVLSFNAHPPSDFYVKLADLYLKEKAFDEAYQQMKKYLEADPHGRFAARIRRIMEQMQSAGVLHSSASNTH